MHKLRTPTPASAEMITSQLSHTLLSNFLKYVLSHYITHVHSIPDHTEQNSKPCPNSDLTKGETNDGVETKTAKPTIRRDDEKTVGWGDITHFVMTQNNRQGEEQTHKTEE